VFYARRGKRLECSLNNPLTADVNPGTGGHLAVHGEPQALEPIEFWVIIPLTDKIRVGDQDTRCLIMRPEFPDRFSGLHEERFVVLEFS